MDDVKKKLFNEFSSLRTAAKLYSHLIENNHRSNAPDSDYMKNLVLHQLNLTAYAEHSLIKASSQQCLSCRQVLSCQFKCDEFKRDNNDF